VVSLFALQKLASIPTSAFYSADHKHLAASLVRFCFFKVPSSLVVCCTRYLYWYLICTQVQFFWVVLGPLVLVQVLVRKYLLPRLKFSAVSDTRGHISEV